MQEALSQLLKPADVVFGIGANCGFLTLIAARLVGPTGRVIAFERLPDAAEQVRKNVAANRFAHVEIREVALSDENGEASFYTSRENAWEKLKKAGLAPGEQTLKITVRVQKLDPSPSC